ncbi:MAG: hypothetical protein LUI09_00415 [Prevotellaceae bacterium]|nr:hypothetical protein [Prevotellaceae bacterium]
MRKANTMLAWTVAGMAACLLLLGELNVIPNGILPPAYPLQIAECLLMLASVPLAFTRVLRDRHTLRILLLALPLLLGLALYFLMMDTSMLYCALIPALALLYIWPRK